MTYNVNEELQQQRKEILVFAQQKRHVHCRHNGKMERLQNTVLRHERAYMTLTNSYVGNGPGSPANVFQALE